MEEQPAPVLRQRHLGPGGRVGQVVEHHGVGGGVGAELVPPDRAVVAALLGRHRVGVGVAGVRERGRSRAATRPTRPGCSGSRRARISPVSTSITRRVLRSSPPSEVPTATSRPSRDGWNQSSAAVSSPWNRCGSRSRRGSAVRVAGRVAHEQGGLVEAAAPLDGEQPVAGHPHAADHAHAEQLGQPGPQPGPRRASASSTARVRSFWAAGPRLHLGVGPVLEPAVRVGHLDAVQHVHHVVAPRRHRRRVRRLAPERFCVRTCWRSPGIGHAESGAPGLVGRARVLDRRAAVAVDGPVTVRAGGAGCGRTTSGTRSWPSGPGSWPSATTRCSAPGRAPRPPGPRCSPS